MKKHIIFLLGLFLMLAACEPVDPVVFALKQLELEQQANKATPSIKTDISDLALPAEEGTATISMSTNGSWKATTSASTTKALDWLTVSPSQGRAGNYKLLVKVAKNDTYDERFGDIVITVTNGNKQSLSDTIHVSQIPEGAIILEKDTFEGVSYEGAVIDLVAQTNVQMKIDVPYGVDWIKEVPYSPVKSLSTEYRSVEVLPNASYSPREAKIYVINEENNIKRSVTIKQEARPLPVARVQNGEIIQDFLDIYKAFDFVDNNGVIELCQDIEISGNSLRLRGKDNVTFDLGGHTIYSTITPEDYDTYAVLEVYTTDGPQCKTFTIKKGTIIHKPNKTEFQYGNFVIRALPTEMLNVEDMTIEMETSGMDRTYGICTRYATLKNVKITSDGGALISGVGGTGSWGYYTIESGEFSGPMICINADLTIKGGYFDGLIFPDSWMEYGKISGKGGYFNFDESKLELFDSRCTGDAEFQEFDKPVTYNGKTYKYTLGTSNFEDCFCFTAVEDDASVEFCKKGNPEVTSFQVSNDGGKEWYTVSEGVSVQLPKVGDRLFVRALNKGSFNKNAGNYFYFNPSKAKVSGNIMYLVDPRGNTRELQSYEFYGLFNNSGLVDAGELELPVTTLAEHCYDNMFFNCSKLISVPSLPATKLAAYCYNNMFRVCGKLTSLPDNFLPATELAYKCYADMFNGCYNLKEAPSLPATTLANHCYENMFRNCTKLISLPSLPATKLADYCYNAMFYGCSELTSLPKDYLPATELAESCYSSMFTYCSSLCLIPDLPATTLARDCYSGMFAWCTDLQYAISLPATTLVDGCYYGMFNMCDKLQLLEVEFTDWNNGNSTGNWLFGVAETGALACPKELVVERGDSKIPVGWNVVCYEETDSDCFHFTATGSDAKVEIKVEGDPRVESLMVSEDAKVWLRFPIGELNGTTLKVTDKMYIKAPCEGHFNYGTFSDVVSFNPVNAKVSGKIMYLVSPTGVVSSDWTMFQGEFRNLFESSELVDAGGLVLPDKTGSLCYSGMFYECEKLTSAPELPATNIAPGSYYGMFAGCKSLNHIKVGFSEWPTNEATGIWVQGVAETGNFECPDALPKTIGISNIPEGWLVNGKALLPEGALEGKFSVSNARQIRFSKGNLQYQASSETWRFAEHQYDFIGNKAGNNTPPESGRHNQTAWIDLFGWGATGRYAYSQVPYSTSVASNEYRTVETPSGDEKLTIDNKADWGYCMGGAESPWRTLTSAEWSWLVGPGVSENPGNTCRTCSTVGGTENARYAHVKVGETYGVILFPDTFTWDAETMGTAPDDCNVKVIDWAAVPTYTATQFAAMETAGVVFLPAAGWRSGVPVQFAGEIAHYWTSNAISTDMSLIFFFSGGNTLVTNNSRSSGASVRLVIDVK